MCSSGATAGVDNWALTMGSIMMSRYLCNSTGLGASHARDPTNPKGQKEVEGLHDVDLLAAGATYVIAIVSHTTADNYDDEAFGYDD